jgi:hypothetical protein
MVEWLAVYCKMLCIFCGAGSGGRTAGMRPGEWYLLSAKGAAFKVTQVERDLRARC